MNTNSLEKYARLIIKTGLNLQAMQILVISSPIECAQFTRLVAQTAYQEGAKDVIIQWHDELFSKIRFLSAPDEVFLEFPAWQKEFYSFYAQQEAAFLSISASDPELMKEVNPEKMKNAQKTRAVVLQEYRERLMSNRNTWCVVSIPTVSWAKKVFPGLNDEVAVTKLWDSIFRTVRVDTDNPEVAWNEHKADLKKRLDVLNSLSLKSVHYKNSLGTDLRIKLPENHLWLGGAETTPTGIEFIANMPTEEVFTLPEKTGVSGTVVSSRPLNYNGNLIEDFSLRFEDGRIVDYSAKSGSETLKHLIETDEGSHYLGEVALVPYDSPISNSKILFFNTLFDENASCHLAIGKAYPVCLANGENLSKEELENSGVNDSLVHVDFMVGTNDLEIVGMTGEGKEIVIFENGNFVL